MKEASLDHNHLDRQKIFLQDPVSHHGAAYRSESYTATEQITTLNFHITVN